MTPFGLLLRHIRDERSISQSDFSKLAGISAKTISAIERGRKRPPDKHTIESWVELLKLGKTDAENLLSAASQSTYQVKIPDKASPLEMSLVHQLVSTLGKLRMEEISMMKSVIVNASERYGGDP